MTLLLFLWLTSWLSPPPAAPPPTARLIAVKRIWDQATHNAFTDLIRFQNRWYCTFRESAGHVEGEGKLRVLTSRDGQQWESATLIAMAGRDLRDPKLVVAPGGRLMIIAGSANPADRYVDFHSLVSFSRNGKNWELPQRVVIKEQERPWLWRVVWHKGTAYGAAYTWDIPAPGARRKAWAWVCRSRDGVNYERISPDFDGNEAALYFDERDKLNVLLRSSTRPSRLLLAQAAAPYQDWQQRPLTVGAWDSQLGGPQILRLADRRLLAAGRLYKGEEQRTGLTLLDAERGTLTELLVLPSNGDSSYPGLVWHQGRLWMSYYSSHEGKSAIYLAQIALP